MKKLLLVLPVLLILCACSKPTTIANVEETAVNSMPQMQVPTQATDIQPTTVSPAPVPTVPVATQPPQRTVIENGEVKVWAEHYDKDKTIKPIKYDNTVNGGGTPIHHLYYNVDGHEIKVSVNEKSGDRYFYEDGSSVNFAVIAENVKKSNEAVLNSYAANMRLNEEMKKKYE